MKHLNYALSTYALTIYIKKDRPHWIQAIENLNFFDNVVSWLSILSKRWTITYKKPLIYSEYAIDIKTSYTNTLGRHLYM